MSRVFIPRARSAAQVQAASGGAAAAAAAGGWTHVTHVCGIGLLWARHCSAELLRLHPPHVIDQPTVAQMRRILGFQVGTTFDLEEVTITLLL